MTAITVEAFLNAWERCPTPSGRHDRERAGPGRWKVTCPLHDDREPSLEVSVGEGGRLLLKCFGACGEKTAVYQPVLETVGLWERDRRVNGAADLGEATIYPYRDEAGQLLFEVVRFPNKEFRQRRGVDARGQPVWGLGNARRVLFGLPELLKTKTGELVCLCEGEKDALAVAHQGIAATCNPMGAGKWRQEYTDWLKEHLADRRFLILPDNDAAGIAHAEEVLQSLKRAGLNVQVARLEGLPPKGDVSDWLRAGGTPAQLRQMAEPEPDPLDALVYDGDKLELLELPEVDVLVPHLMFRRFSTLLAGDSKLGKSTLLLRMLVAMACGGWWLDATRSEKNRLPISRVLYINWEDLLSVTRDRAREMMAPERIPKNLHVMDVPYGHSLARVLEWLRVVIPRDNYDAVVIDPIAIAAEWKDEDDNAEVSLTFKALQQLAAETGAAILSVHHVTKQPGTRGRNIRGASGIKANVMGFLVLEEEEGRISLEGINKLSGHWKSYLGRSRDQWSWWIEEEVGIGADDLPQPKEKPVRESSYQKACNESAILRIIRDAEQEIRRTGDEELRADYHHIHTQTDDLGIADATLKQYLSDLVKSGRAFAWNRPQPGRPKRFVYGCECRSEEEARFKV